MKRNTLYKIQKELWVMILLFSGILIGAPFILCYKKNHPVFELFNVMQAAVKSQNRRNHLFMKKDLEHLTFCIDSIYIIVGLLLLLSVIFLYFSGYEKHWKKCRGIVVILMTGFLLIAAVVLGINILWNQATGTKNTLSSTVTDGILVLNQWYYWSVLLLIGLFVRLGEKIRLTENNSQRKTNKGKNSWVWLLGMPVLLAMGKILWDDENYYFLSVCVIFLTVFPFLKKWELEAGKKGREIVMIAVMSAIAVISRSVFYMLPQVKPMAAIVIITGAALGANAGFMTGAVSALVSNFIFGQGPWTPWQMIAFGILGFLSGIFFSGKKTKSRKQIIIFALYGGITVFIVYGPIMDTGTVFMFTNGFSVNVFLSCYWTGIPFNFVHGLATFLFIMLLGRPILKKLYRIKKKYGI